MIDLFQRRQRKPLLDAARMGNPQAIDAALAKLPSKQLPEIRRLAEGDWQTDPDLRSKMELLLERLRVHEEALGLTSPQFDIPSPAPTTAPTPPMPARQEPGPSRGSRAQVSPVVATRTPEGRSIYT